MNWADLGLGITTAVLSLGAIVASSLAAIRSNQNAREIAEMEHESNLRLWQRNLMFPAGVEIINLISEFSDALILLNLDKENIVKSKRNANTVKLKVGYVDTIALRKHLDNILRLHQKISNNVICFVPMLIEAHTHLIDKGIEAFINAWVETTQNQTWLDEDSF